MKKAISLFMAFILVSAFTAGILYLCGFIFKSPYLSDPSNCLSIGLTGGLGGLIGPVVAAYVSRLFSHNKAE